MDDRQIRDEILTLFVAGHETTASGLAWTLHLLLQHPWAYARARTEVDALPDRPVRATYILHRRGDLWPQPERFDPDRFQPQTEASRPRSAYIPFGDGPRTCIGKHFALMEGPIVLATMLQHADLTPVSEARPVAGATLRPHGLEARIRLRRRASTTQEGETWTTSA